MTWIVIAHRFESIRRCDNIMVIVEGRIVQNGNYDELIKKKGVFYSLKEG